MFINGIRSTVQCTHTAAFRHEIHSPLYFFLFHQNSGFGHNTVCFITGCSNFKLWVTHSHDGSMLTSLCLATANVVLELELIRPNFHNTFTSATVQKIMCEFPVENLCLILYSSC